VPCPINHLLLLLQARGGKALSCDIESRIQIGKLGNTQKFGTQEKSGLRASIPTSRHFFA